MALQDCETVWVNDFDAKTSGSHVPYLEESTQAFHLLCDSVPGQALAMTSHRLKKSWSCCEKRHKRSGPLVSEDPFSLTVRKSPLPDTLDVLVAAVSRMGIRQNPRYTMLLTVV